MSEPIVDRAVAILGATARVTVPVAELARSLGTGDADSLAGRLARDPRLRVLDPPALPGFALIPDRRAAAYHRALRAAGIRPARRVALVGRPAPPPDADIDVLLRHTTARLLSTDGAPDGPPPGRVVDAAERTNRAVIATRPGVGRGPSTSRPPRPPRSP